jgi:hypothetical protein
VENIFGRDILVQIPYFKKKDPPKTKLILKSREMVTIACKLKGCLRLSTFIFWILPNLAKFTYGSTPIEHLTYLQFSVIKWAKQRSGQNPFDVKSGEAIQI